MSTESQLTRNLCKRLEKLGCDSFAVVGGKMQAPGWPDRAFFAKGLPGGCAWVEFKQERGKLSAKQLRVLERLNKRHVLAVVYRFGSNQFETCNGNVLCYVDYKDEKLWLKELKDCGDTLGCFIKAREDD